MKYGRSVIGLAMVLALVGCGSRGAQIASQPLSPANMAALEAGLTGGLNLANACLASRLGPCGNVVTRPKIIADEHKAVDAYDALKAATAEGQSVAMIAFNTALRELLAGVPAAPTVTK